jgi:hypothetical protein
MKFVPQTYDRFGGEVQPTDARAKVGLLEPLATRFQFEGTSGTVFQKASVSFHSEQEVFWESLRRTFVPCDLLPPMADLSPYEVVFVPSGLCLAAGRMDNLIKYIRGGGTVIATLAPGLYDEYSKPDGRLLKAIGVTAKDLPMAKRTVTLSNGSITLPPAVVYSYATTKTFKGKVVARYKDGSPCWLEAPLGKGKVILIGWAANVSVPVLRTHVIPAVINRAALTDWRLETRDTIDCFVRQGDGYRLFFVTNESHEKPASATLTFDAPHDVIELRSAVRARARKTIAMPRLWPGEGRVFKVMPCSRSL